MNARERAQKIATDVREFGPFTGTWEFYLDRGWEVFPLPDNAKFPPMGGVTGRDGRPLNRVILEARDVNKRKWPERENIALRMPDGVVGMDVDQYADKAGRDNLEALIKSERLTPLPPTFYTSGRGAGVSGIRYYRVPEGWEPWNDHTCEDVEWIRRSHRYAVVWPSKVHDEKADRDYTWYHEDTGDKRHWPPRVSDLPHLPEDWIEHFDQPHTEDEQRRYANRGGDVQSVKAWNEAHGGLEEDTCLHTVMLLNNGLHMLQRAVDKKPVHGKMYPRHGVALLVTKDLGEAAQAGHRGVARALGIFAHDFIECMDTPTRRASAASELAGMFRQPFFTIPEKRPDDPCVDDDE